tara:strand:+ start:1471 stop:1641 length:171 start_codon:yes stop_codon:yes gene_type:complete
MEYWGTGKYIGSEFVDEFGSEIEIGNDEENGVYSIRFTNGGGEFNNVFEEEIEFNN